MPSRRRTRLHGRGIVSAWQGIAALYADDEGIIRSSNAAARSLLRNRAMPGVPLAATLMHIGWAADPRDVASPGERILRFSSGPGHVGRLDRLERGGKARWRLTLLALPPSGEADGPPWRVMGQLAASVAHEIRNPLTTVRGFLQMLQEEISPGVGQEHLAIVLREVDRVTELVGDFLTLTRPVYAEHRPVDVGDIARDVLQVSERLLADRGQTSTLCLEGTLACVNGNRLQLRQVLLNLVRNASDASPVGGRVEVQIISTRNERVHVRVVDNGPGFAPDVRDRAFEPFFTTKETGTGLGLVICRQIVEAHGGYLAIEETAGGAAVAFSLPALVCETAD